MPYSPQHKKESRLRILESAARCFLHQGYERTGIDEVMRGAGMTRGAFYAHFKSKSELYAKAMTHAATYGRFMEYQRSGKNGSEWLRGMLKGYLNQEHFDGDKTPCPMAFLVTDVASRDLEVRKTYTRIYKRMNQIIGHHATESSMQDTDSMFAVTAMMIGGVALGRAVDDTDLAKRILASCRQAAVQLLDEES